MAEKEVQAKFRIRTDTAENWLNANPVLLKGELAFEEDTNLIKIGDGESAWNVLPYFRTDAGTSAVIRKEFILKDAFPIGSIKITATNENPANSLGGVWERWGSGRVPIAVDENDADFATAEQTGGEKTHTLTDEEIPSHAHNAELPISGESVVGGKNGTNQMATDGTLTVSTDAVGGGKAHNNMPPYITCYFWKRTA